jgi:hypothetical protein
MNVLAAEAQNLRQTRQVRKQVCGANLRGIKPDFANNKSGTLLIFVLKSELL